MTPNQRLDKIEKLLTDQLAAAKADDMDTVESLSADISELAAGFSESPPRCETQLARINALNQRISVTLAAAEQDLARELAAIRKTRKLLSYKMNGQ